MSFRENWRRHALTAAAILAILGVVVYVARPSPHIPPYDANLVRLAETPRQGYCAAIVLWTKGMEDAEAASVCREEHAGTKAGKVDMVATERAFCEGIVDSGWEGDVAACLGIMAQNQYWPTYDGFISNSWNRARPYPKPPVTGDRPAEDGSRTGGRDGSASRPGPPYYTGPPG